MTIQHDFPFDPTNGYTLDRLRAIRGPEEPEGFREFWAAAGDVEDPIIAMIRNRPAMQRLHISKHLAAVRLRR